MVVSGINNKPEKRTEYIISRDWDEVHRILADICDDFHSIIKSIYITETNQSPFDYKVRSAIDSD